jgi:hypothetical protein
MRQWQLEALNLFVVPSLGNSAAPLPATATIATSIQQAVCLKWLLVA